jgi:hypothetical protein
MRTLSLCRDLLVVKDRVITLLNSTGQNVDPQTAETIGWALAVLVDDYGMDPEAAGKRVVGYYLVIDKIAA